MKKLLLCVVTLGLVGLPACAEMNFYRARNGQIVLEATDCQSAARLISLVTPDDPPGGTTQEDEPADNPPSAGEDPATNPVQDGIQTVIEAVLGDDQPAPKQGRSFKGISEETQNLVSTDNFNEHQEELLTFVRDVNWKTGLQLTWSDMSFFRRLKMVCTGVNKLTKPVRVNLESYTGSLDNIVDSSTDKAVTQLANAARNHSFADMAKLSIVGLIDALDQENPFLLLAIDEETYEKLVEKEPKIATLFEDMYTFFKIRSVLLGTDYNQSVKDLVRMSKLGKGDYFKTWNVLAQYAKKMLELERQGKLTPQDEKEVHIWRLNSAMEYIKEHGRVEKRAAELAIKNPENSEIVKEVQNGPKKKPSLDEKAQELLRKSTQDEIKQLIYKYEGK